MYEQKIDVAAERERLTKEIAKFEKSSAMPNGSLGNSDFLAKAPAKVVEGIRETKESECC